MSYRLRSATKRFKKEIELKETKFPDPLIIEKSSMRVMMFKLTVSGVPNDGKNRKKNKKDSIDYRERANKMLSEDHSSELHEKMLKLYSQSVALAPNNSEELALAFADRSLLLYHLKKYEDCMKDCDLALEVAKCDILKTELLFCKVQCLKDLNDSKANQVCNDVLHLIHGMNIDSSVKNIFTSKLNDLANYNSEQSNANQKSSEPEEIYEIPAFIPSKEAPSASEAIAIEYNEEWGRHIVATRHIEPGEIIALEKIYYSFIYPEKMWVYCQYCSKLAWSSIPCKGCIFGIYCSENCRQQAWNKFHKYECGIFPYVWDIDADINRPTSILRLLLIATHESGGIKQLKNQVMDVYNNKDPRTRGFSKDGAFQSDKFRSFFSLISIRAIDRFKDNRRIKEAGLLFYYLATKTDFFGEKFSNPLSVLKVDDAVFFSGLMAKLFYLLLPDYNTSELIIHYDESVAKVFGMSIAPICSFMNHSCDPNVITIKTKNEEILAYAKYPIRKGEKIFRSYLKQEFLEQTQSEQEKLLDAAKFQCKCLACKEKNGPSFNYCTQRICFKKRSYI